jgi:bifunctional N-acetylglucosamine-1-phosphate-uridyltransferase/glucosamine-1-phosphate-acetyltransferase GlmU-like protein
VLVIGHGGDEVRSALASRENLQFAVQSPQLGTGHALLQAEQALSGKKGTVLLLYADVPLLELSTLGRLLEHHRETRAAATVLTASSTIRTATAASCAMRAAPWSGLSKNATRRARSARSREINSGIYAFELAPLFPALHGLAADNAQGEYYLTDLVARTAGAGWPSTHCASTTRGNCAVSTAAWTSPT